MLTQKRLKEVLSYDPCTGIFVWTLSIGRGINAINIAGYKKTIGYINIGIDGDTYLAHRLAFLYMDGKFPDGHTDHIDGIRDNNRWDNLRDITRAENAKNKRVYSNNKSGVTGVHQRKSGKKWIAKIDVDGQRISLGCFDSMSDAVRARKNAEAEYDYHQNHGRAT